MKLKEGQVEYKASYGLGLFPVKKEIVLQNRDSVVRTAYPGNNVENSNFNLVVILNEKNNQLQQPEIDELANYLSSYGFIISIIDLKDELNNQDLKKLVSKNVKILSKHFKDKSYNIINTAIIGHNINARLKGYYNIDYNPLDVHSVGKLPTLFITSKTCDISWKYLTRVTCVNLNEKLNIKELHSQIRFWLQLQLSSCPPGFIKTADGMFGNVICEPFPKFAINDVLFPFEPQHPVYCTQGNLSKFPYSHFWQNTMYALDLASPKTASSGKIYAAFDGTAYIYNKCKATDNINYCGYGYGNFIYLLRGDGVFAGYAHLDKIYIRDKQSIKKGQLIGLEGNTGLAGSRHLHFSLHLLRTDSAFFNVHTKGHDTTPFWLKIKKTHDAKGMQIISYDIPPSEQELIYGDWTIDQH